MMRVIIITTIIIFFSGQSFGQKKSLPIDSRVIEWEEIEKNEISNDGKYVAYQTFKRKPKLSESIYEVHVTAIDRSWTYVFQSESDCDFQFSEDSKSIVLMRSGSCDVVVLGTGKRNTYEDIYNIKVVGNYLIYNKLNNEFGVCIADLNKGDDILLSDVRKYIVDKKFGQILIEKKVIQDSSEIMLYNVEQRTVKQIYKGGAIKNVQFLKDGNVLVTTPDGNQFSVWIYFTLRNSLIKVLESINTRVLLENFEYDGVDINLSNGERLFFYLKRISKLRTKLPNTASVDIWSYFDLYPQSMGSEIINNYNNQKYLFALDVSTLSINQLETPYRVVIKNLNNVFVFGQRQINLGLVDLKKECKPTRELTLSNLSFNKEFKVPFPVFNFRIDPRGRFVILYNEKERDYYSYDFLQEKLTNITSGIKTDWEDRRAEKVDYFATVHGEIGWMDNRILIRDEYDIWAVDPLGIRKPQNLTNSYGRRNNIDFSFSLNPNAPVLRSTNEKLFLTGFDYTNKDNGFFVLSKNSNTDPVKLTMGPFLYDAVGRIDVDQGQAVKKAKYHNMYLIKRMSAKESPNLFVSTDLKSFTPISDVYPERKINWYKTELINYKTKNGVRNQGVLYFPENFDSTTKYPIIFHYYEKKSNGLNAFIAPELSEGNLNIATYVSNGYLIFCPDIHYDRGKPMLGALDAVVSAAEILSARKYIDKNKMGLQGHSYGAYETNFILCRSKLFAAACSASGLIDIVSGYDQRWNSGASFQSFYETGQGRMGIPLWAAPEAYLLNSSIMNVSKISTPLLLMANKKDSLSYAQGTQFMFELTRLSKKAWMLQYDNSEHTLDNDIDRHDFTIRMQQFFDHYLKGNLAPSWMTRGIAPYNKGFDNGLELDGEIKTPDISLNHPEL